jgi:hypothetical protein
LTQGRWISTAITPAYSAIMVPSTAGISTPAIDTVWALAQDGSTLIKLKASGAAQTAGAVTGNVYTLGTTTVSAVNAGSYTIQSSASGQQMSLTPILGTTVVFNRSDAMSSALRADQVNGRWAATLDSATVNWTVQTSSTGTKNVTGTSTTGCTYSGQTTIVASQSLYSLLFTETCGATTQTFTGVATMSSDDSRLSVVATNEQEARAAALVFARQP